MRNVTTIPNAILDSLQLNSSEKLVMISLYKYKKCDGIFPSIENICKLTSLSRSTVKRTLRRLELLNIIKVRIGGGRKSSQYILPRRLILIPEKLKAVF